MTVEDIDKVDAIVDDIGVRVAKQTKTQEEFAAWLTMIRDSLTQNLEMMGLG